MSKPSTSVLTPSRKTLPAPPRLALDAVLGCAYLHYPWDDWERFALSRGLDAELAGLGRLLIREAFNHSWEAWLQNLCGWGDDLSADQAGGQALLAFALRAPEKARWCFSRLMDTDGLRGDYHPKTQEWTWGYLRLDVRRVLSTLHNQLSPDNGLVHS